MDLYSFEMNCYFHSTTE